MKVLVAGLTPQLSAAMEMIIGSVFSNVRVVQHVRGTTCTPLLLAADARRCDLSVIDLLGFGWATCTPERDAELQDAVLGDRPAIVLLPAGDGGGWAAARSLHQPTPARITLQHPTSMSSLQSALMRLRQARDETPAPPLRAPKPAPQAPTAHATPTRAPWPGAAAPPLPADPTPTAPLPPRERAPAPGQPPPAPPFALTAAGFQALQAACPGLGAHPFLSRVVDIALRGAPCEFTIGTQSGAVFLPAENWVASSISTALRKRLTQHRLMLQIVEVRPLSAAQARAQAQRLFGRRDDGRRALDTFLFSLAWQTLQDDPPRVDSHFRFQLQRFPNLTRMPGLPDLALQLALFAHRRPLSVDDLQRAFSRHDPRQLSLFVVCAVVSGLADALAADAAPVAPAAPRADAPKRGFIRALLAKLF